MSQYRRFKSGMTAQVQQRKSVAEMSTQELFAELALLTSKKQEEVVTKN